MRFERTNSSICFVAFVFGTYEKYIPYYIFSILKVYPKAFVMVFVDGEISFKVGKSLEILKSAGKGAYDILHLKNDYKFLNEFNIKGGSYKMVRWILNEEYFRNFDYLYIGDIDILFLPEKISLIDFHTSQMIRLQLPFSNMVRRDDFGKSAKRLTGLHFIEVKDYFEKISPVVDHFVKDSAFRNDFMTDVERDEHFLYKINKLAFNFNDELLMKAERPWHGVHLGITRGNKNVDLSVIKENTTLSLQDTKQQLIEIIKDPLFQKLQNLVFVVELDVILQELDLHRPLKWKIKRLMYKIDNRFRIQKNIERLKRKLKL